MLHGILEEPVLGSAARADDSARADRMDRQEARATNAMTAGSSRGVDSPPWKPVLRETLLASYAKVWVMEKVSRNSAY